MASDLNFRFEPLREDHLPMLFNWLQQPHVREFYQRKTPVLAEMKVNTQDSPTRQYIFSLDQPLGYIQTYRIQEYADYTAPWGVSSGISLDYLIGEPASLGQGLATPILVRFLRKVAFPLFPNEDTCWIIHDLRNEPAMRASKAAGFCHSRDFDFHGHKHALLHLMRHS